MSEQKSFPLTRLRLLSDVIRRGISPTYADFGTPVANQKCVRPHGKFNVSHARNHDTNTRSISLENFVQPGDALINSTGTGTLGRSTVISSIDSPLTWDSHITLVRPHKDLLEPRFLSYVLQNSENRFITLSQGSTNQIELSRDTVSNLPIPAIDLPTQRHIADYLDRETAQIDAMAGALDGLVARLEERRRSIVSAYMDPFSECCTVPIGISAKVTLGKTVQNEPRNDTKDSPVKYIRAANIQPNGVLSTDNQSMFANAAEIAALDLRIGDVLVVEGGAGYGRSLTLEKPLTGWVFQNHIIRVRPYSGWHGKYIDYGIRHLLYTGYIEQIARGATIPGLSAGNLRSLLLIYRSFDEQRRIADHLDAETAKIDAMIAKAGELRALLDERRSALITATVTGQRPVPEEK